LEQETLKNLECLELERRFSTVSAYFKARDDFNNKELSVVAESLIEGDIPIKFIIEGDRVMDHCSIHLYYKGKDGKEQLKCLYERKKRDCFWFPFYSGSMINIFRERW